jgi:nucleoside-diphosphate-sugar epimerase
VSAPAPRSLDELDALLSAPSDAVVAALRACPGDVVVLGAGGKMGPSLTRMLVRAAAVADAVGALRRVFAVSRFTSPGLEESLRGAGAIPVACDLLDEQAVAALPDAPNVLFLAGQKFGTAADPARTWAMNVTVPTICAARYAGSRMVAFSTGNVYPLVPPDRGGSRESDAPAPVGTYAESCLGRERVFEAAALRGSPVAIMRLNYAIALVYGVLTDIACAVRDGAPVSLAMSHVNVIWQGDASRAAIELLPHAATPAQIVNVTGPDPLAVRDLAQQVASRMGRPVSFDGAASGTALVSDTSLMRTLLAAPEISVQTMVEWTAAWVGAGRPLLDKPTKFAVRDGAF